MSTQNSIHAIEMIHFDSSNLTGGYDVLNADGLDEACYMLRITNDSGTDVIVSYDGATNHDYVRTGEVLQIYAIPSYDRSNFKKGTIVYLVGNASQGYIYLSGYYKLPC